MSVYRTVVAVTSKQFSSMFIGKTTRRRVANIETYNLLPFVTEAITATAPIKAIAVIPIFNS